MSRYAPWVAGDDRVAGGRISRRVLLTWGAALGAGAAVATGTVLVIAEGGQSNPVGLKERARLGINHPLMSLAARERDLEYVFPIVGGLYYSFDTNWSKHTADRLPAVGRELLVCWMPKVPEKTLSLTDITAGGYDDHIDQMLRGMRSFAGPVVVRWGHEPNGNWYTWAAANMAGATPGQYVAAWRYIVGRERSMPGQSNIRWFWCPSGSDVSSPEGVRYTLEQYWPGDDWVDIVGCDAYNEPNTWQPFDAVLRRPYARISKLTHKPFWIGEVGCHEPVPGQPGNKGAWIEAMLDSHEFPNMQAVCYFDVDATSVGRADWRFNSTADTYASVKRSIRAVRRV